jgi:hypothetical protein
MTEDETIVPAEGNNQPKSDTPAPQASSTVPAVSAIPEKAASTPLTPAPTPEKNDFTKILEEVKLPERRDFKAIADTPKAEPAEPGVAILEEHIIKRSADAPAAAMPAPNPPQVDEAPQAGERSSSIIAPFRTLKDDLQTVVREQKISLVHAATLEEEKKHGQEHLAPEQKEIRAHRSRRAVGIIFASCILVLLGAGAIFGVFYVTQQQQSIPPAPQSSILFAEQTVAFSLDNQKPQDLKNSLAQARTKQLGSLGSITRVVPTILSTSTSATGQEMPATISQFFSALGMNPPQELMSAIGPSFFFGFHVVDTNAPLLVIPVTSYDHAFAGMLAWEPTMDNDLAPIFTAVSMTTATSGIPVQRTFEDTVMRNYDVRELTDDSGNVVLYYSFPTPNILVIAQSPYSFTEILSRLQAQREL